MGSVDVHIVVGTKEQWLDKCLESLKNEPVTTWLVSRIEGDIAKARENGFSKGNSEYVSFVDPDDVVIAGAFSKCIKALDADTALAGVYTDDMLIDEQGNFISHGFAVDERPFREIGFPSELMKIHHLRVFRRKFVEKCLPLKTKMVPEPILNVEIQNHGMLLHLPFTGYQWRMHPGNTIKRYTKEQCNEAIAYVRALRPTTQTA